MTHFTDSDDSCGLLSSRAISRHRFYTVLQTVIGLWLCVILNKAPPRAGATQEKRKRTCVNDPLSVSRVPAFTVQDFGLVAAGEVNCASLKVRSCSFGF